MHGQNHIKSQTVFADIKFGS